MHLDQLLHLFHQHFTEDPGSKWFFTPDVAQRIVRLCKLQQAAVFAELGDEGEESEEQLVGPPLLVLLCDLGDKKKRIKSIVSDCVSAEGQESAQTDVHLRSCLGWSPSPAGAAGLGGAG